ncbi:MAG: twin-arginine translocase subunit TatC [Halobacteriales archaeon]
MAEDREEPSAADAPASDEAASAGETEGDPAPDEVADQESEAERTAEQGRPSKPASADDEESESDPSAEPKTCAGLTKEGEPCGRRVGEDKRYCYLHEDQADPATEYAPAPDNPEELVGGSASLEEYAEKQGPSADQEMPLADHIQEMLKRLAVIVAVAGVVSLATFPFAERLINLLWNSILPAGEVTRPRLYGILELKLTELKVASLVGLIVALPVLVYQAYQFMKPGLYSHERRYYLAAIPTSLVLALIGVAFAHFIVLPAIFTYFLYYSETVATIGFALGRTFDLILLLMGYLAIVFQIPLFIMLAMMMGLVTRRWLAQRRLLFWGAFLGISFIFSPDPTGMAPIVVALTMIGLFEGTLLLTKWTRRGRAIGGERSVKP